MPPQSLRLNLMVEGRLLGAGWDWDLYWRCLLTGVRCGATGTGLIVAWGVGAPQAGVLA